MKVVPFRSLGNDLYADYMCPKCYNLIKFTGYNDHFFFSAVNAEPRVSKCNCGEEYWFQWKNDGVHIWTREEKEVLQ